MKTAIIGLTGGIGSGKTTVAGYFSALGAPVYIADTEAKKILNTPAAIAEVLNAFGESVFTNNLPDRQKLAKVVFNNPQNLQILNSIIHPKVKNHFNNWLQEHKNFWYVIKETAILFESGSYKDCDKVILVTAPIEIRIQRVMERDNITREEVLQRMANQWDDDQKTKLSDYIIENTTLESAQNSVKEINQILNNNASLI